MVAPLGTTDPLRFAEVVPTPVADPVVAAGVETTTVVVVVVGWKFVTAELPAVPEPPLPVDPEEPDPPELEVAELEVALPLLPDPLEVAAGQPSAWLAVYAAWASCSVVWSEVS